MRDIMLTVYCLTYNHEKYIRKTLEGFVSQNTSYRYKVIVHDDASTDKTAEIVREYATRYPEIIFPIFQTENQYSKGVNIVNTYIYPLLEGKYVAICEGDDYWCDENKVQLQIDYMESHPECSLCVHNTEKIGENGERLGNYFNCSKEDGDYSPERVIEAGGGGLFHTSSFLYKRELRDRKPKAFSMKGVGDYPLAIFLSTCGYVHYFAEVMSCYRVFTEGSWSVRVSTNQEKKNVFACSAMKALDEMNAATDYRYNESFEFAKMRYHINTMGKGKKLIYAIASRKYRRLFFLRYLEEKRKKLPQKDYLCGRN